MQSQSQTQSFKSTHTVLAHPCRFQLPIQVECTVQVKVIYPVDVPLADFGHSLNLKQPIISHLAFLGHHTLSKCRSPIHLPGSEDASRLNYIRSQPIIVISSHQALHMFVEAITRSVLQPPSWVC